LNLCISAFAQADTNVPVLSSSHTKSSAYNWYCKRTDDHSQPSLDHLLSFIEKEELGAYYADKAHTDFNDEDKVIYLTFDAGYENGNIEKILNVLKEKEATGAFFILENLIARNPELVKRMQSEGHLVCNHTATHPDMSKKSGRDAFMQELDRLNTVAKDAGIEIAPYYRPPEGRFSEENLEIAAKEGYKTVFWSYAYADWDNNSQLSPDDAKQKVLSGTHNGEIILLHPTSATNAAILGDLIDSWREMGFRFASLDELCAK